MKIIAPLPRKRRQVLHKSSLIWESVNQGEGDGETEARRPIRVRYGAEGELIEAERRAEDIAERKKKKELNRS